ncbi:hypothetical protein MHYP_G00342300 [Metynnis hypsauchen]
MASWVHLGLSVWFGGEGAKNWPYGNRTVSSSINPKALNTTTGHKSTLKYLLNLFAANRKQSCSDNKDRAFNTETSSTAALCATVKGDVFLLVSPVVLPCCYSYVLSVCAERGFHLMGLQRVQISSKRASSLGLTSEQISVFCHAPTVFLDGELYSHCLVLLLRKENALRHCGSLSTEGLMNEFAVKGLVGLLHARLASDVQLAPDLCFHAVPYKENLLNFLGGLMWTLPDFSHVILSNHRYPSYSEMEQIVILTLTGHNIMEEGISLLHKVISGDVADAQRLIKKVLLLILLPNTNFDNFF